MTFLRWGLVVSGWPAFAAAMLLSDANPLRVFVTAAFLVTCPGLSAVRTVRPTALHVSSPAAALEAAVLSVVLSLSLAVLVAEALFLSGVFTAGRALLALAVLTSALALVPRRAHSPRPAEES